MRAASLLVLPFVAAASSASEQGGALLRSWTAELESSADTPITRVVNLLKDMQKTLTKDMEEDEALFKKLGCWCHDGKVEKQESIEASTAKVEELKSTIESLTAKSSELSTTIKELGEQIASDNKALSEATAIREKELAEFHGMETDNVQALENLKAAIVVLSKHQNAPPDSTVAGGAVFKSERDRWSFLQTAVSQMPWSADAVQADRETRSLSDFMRRNGFDDVNAAESVQKPVAPHKFLQASSAGTQKSTEWSSEDSAIVKKALHSVATFMQVHHREGYFPAYTSQSGEIFGVLKQLEEEMQGDLSESQKTETARAKSFAELREAKTAQIKEGEKLEEKKEDELATTNNNLAEGKEDLAAEEKILAEDTEFLKNLNDLCDNGEAEFEKRKTARLNELKAVGETVEILQGDDARDAMSSTYNTASFLQTNSVSKKQERQRVAKLLRSAARTTGNPALLVLATSAELDAFSKVKAAIDQMVSVLKQQQEDEVKKNDWCKEELHSNEMTTAKNEDLKASLEAKIEELGSTIKTLSAEIEAAHAAVAQAHLDLQHASEDRKAENLDFQKTVADQTVTIEVLKKALDRLATFYGFVQVKLSDKPVAPVPQKEYAPHSGASGVMEMIEKLVFEAQDLRKGSTKAENGAQAAYEQLVADTNGSVEALHKSITEKSAAKADAEKDKLSTESDHGDTVKELEGLAKYNAELHQECDYLLKNFDLRQSKRAEEIESLAQAKQILSGASFSS